MKTLLSSTAALMLLGTLTLGMSETVDEQIAAIQEAEPAERVALMNQFKGTLSTLTAEEREAAIEEMRSTMEANGDQVQTKAQTRSRLQLRVDQAEQTEDMLRTQQANRNNLGVEPMQQQGRVEVPVEPITELP